jgi:hypothetical protein
MKINIHTSRPSAFISSTFLDLEEERNAVANVLRESNLDPNALDVKPASNDSSRKVILNGIKESDFIILIIGERYGSIIPRMTGSQKLSITRWEYIRAVKSYGKDALVYFKRVESEDSIYYDDYLSDDYEMKRGLLADFKKELSNTHNPKYFTTAVDLAEEVRNAIIPTYRAGVKSLVTKNESLMKKVEGLELENQKLRNTSATTKDSSQLGLLGGLTHPMQKGLLGGISEIQGTSNNIKGLGLLGYNKSRAS